MILPSRFKIIIAVLAYFLILIIWQGIAAYLYVFYKLKISYFLTDFIVYFLIGASLLNFFNRRNSLLICLYVIVLFVSIDLIVILFLPNLVFGRKLSLSQSLGFINPIGLVLIYLRLTLGVLFRSFIASKRNPVKN